MRRSRSEVRRGDRTAGAAGLDARARFARLAARTLSSCGHQSTRGLPRHPHYGQARAMDGVGGAADGEIGHEDDRVGGGSTADSGLGGKLLAVSDLHVSYAENRSIVKALRPQSEADWLLVAGDVSERLADIALVLRLLTRRFAQVVWVPGNHDLWSSSTGDDQMRGVARYDLLVALCRELGVLTPEDPYPIWHGAGGPVRIAPLFVLYDYTFRPPGTSTKEEGLAYAYRTGVVCNDEFRLHPDPYPSREAWCRDRVALTQQRLDECDPSVPLVLVNHYPLVREPTKILRYPEFAQWCGTTSRLPSMGICTFHAQRGMTECDSKRYRSVIPANGAHDRPRPFCRARSFRVRKTGSPTVAVAMAARPAEPPWRPAASRTDQDPRARSRRAQDRRAARSSRPRQGRPGCLRRRR